MRTNKFKYVIYSNLIAVGGAMLGGIVIFSWSSFNNAQLIDFMLGIPAIHTYMLEHVHEAMDRNTLTALVTGPIFGVPYKLFAALAPEYTNIFMFLIFTIPARLIRFTAVSALAFFLSNYVFKTLAFKFKILIWLALWCIVYVIYFSIHSPF